MLEANREEGEHLDSLVKRFRRLITKHKILQEVRGRAYYMSPAVKERLKKRKTNRKGSRPMTSRPHNNHK